MWTNHKELRRFEDVAARHPEQRKPSRSVHPWLSPSLGHARRYRQQTNRSALAVTRALEFTPYGCSSGLEC